MYKTVDLFSGAGGLSFGFEETDEFMIVAAAESDADARRTYIENHKKNGLIKMIEDVRKYNFRELTREFDGIDIVIGGPPCQGFSNANRQKNHAISMNNSLIKEFFRAVREMEPRAFVMENVDSLSSKTHKFYDSYNDSEEINEMGITKKEEKFVLSEKGYPEIDLLNVLLNGREEYYSVSSILFRLLNVLYKNREKKEGLKRYIEKNRKVIITQIDNYFSSERFEHDLLTEIKESLKSEESVIDFEGLGDFLKLQKAFLLKREFDENEIIYRIEECEEEKIIARVHTYSVIDYVRAMLNDLYKKTECILNSLDFGVPQERRRFFLIGIREGYTELDSKRFAKNMKKGTSVADAIFDIKDCIVYDEVSRDQGVPYAENDKISSFAKKMRLESNKLYNHIVPKTGEEALKRFAELKEGENFHNLSEDMKKTYANPGRTQNSIYLRLDSSKPSGTVVNVRKSMWIHPKLNRAISVREAARLQSFPDRFRFFGSKDSQYQQVGNAVPPLMAQGIAMVISNKLAEGMSD